MADQIIIDDTGFVTTKFRIHQDGTFDVKRTQDVEAIINHNKNLQAEGFSGYTPSGDMKHVASIPLIVIEQWARKWGIPMNEIMGPRMHEVIRKELNDPDNAFLRTGKGRL